MARLTNESRDLGGRLPEPLAARQDRALDPRGELHRVVLVEDLRQVRHRHLGDPADRLSAHPARSAEPRAARLFARGELQLVSLFRQPGEDAAGALAAAEDLAADARDHEPDGGLGGDPGRSGAAAGLRAGARQGRLRARLLGRGDRDRRGGQRLHDEEIRPRPGVRLLADPGDVDDLLRRRRALPVAARRHLHVVLRLVLRPAAVDRRRPGASRPTCRRVPTGTMPAS